MFKTKYTFEEFQFSSQLIRDFSSESESVMPFISRFFSKKNLVDQANQKSFSHDNRVVLREQLILQNKSIELSEKTRQNIDLIEKDNTFTITTGHQLNLATGPLYTIYKILEVINQVEEMNTFDTKHHFVPVFWMATEDHDFDEINYINLFGSKINWQHQSVENKVVGRIETESIGTFIDDILERFGNEALREKVTSFLASYSESSTLAEANRALINSVFGEYGLVIIDGDDPILKTRFKSVALREIEEGVSYNNVIKTNALLEEKQYHSQVYVRPLNLFYIHENGRRERIKSDGDKFEIGNDSFEKEALTRMVESAPERFSPNALLRPVYQEAVLPNLAYIGGGGEIAYWLQLKSTFEAFNIDFPLLKVRDSVVLVTDKMNQQMEEFGYSIIDLKQDTDALIKNYILENSEENITLQSEKEGLNDLKNKIIKKAVAVDKNAERFVEAEFQRISNQFEKMEKKFVQMEKKNKEKSIKQLERLQKSIFPLNSFQERYDNILSYVQYQDIVAYLKNELKQRMTESSAIHIIEISK